MFTRILMNPASTDGGAAPAQAPAAPVVPPAPTPPPTVPVAMDEWQRLQGIASQWSAAQVKMTADMAAKEAERIQALHDKGETQKAMEETRKSLTKQYEEEKANRLKLEQQYHGEKKSAALSTALLGTTFVSDIAASQVKAILDGSFETRVDGNGMISVVDRITGRPAVDVIKEKLASPEYAHFLKPSTQGGAGGGGSQPANTSTDNANPFANMDISKPIGVFQVRR